MQVMKFGGASVRDAAAVRNVAEILQGHQAAASAVVVSAMGKTTNALDNLAAQATAGYEQAAYEALAGIKDFHQQIYHELFPAGDAQLAAKLTAYYDEIERILRGILLLGDFPFRIHDRILAFGELLSTTIVYHYLAPRLAVRWIDARTIIRTDSRYQHASVLYSQTRQQILQQVLPAIQAGEMVITPGFIGANQEGRTTTLGREGSDYTAAILGAALGAERVVIWKDVPGVMSADPRIDPHAQKLARLTYEQAVEMTFYGASVIHPKTIKPLQNQAIPLQVRSFKDHTEPGTLIQAPEHLQAPERIATTIYKHNQVLLDIRPRDFSFMDPEHVRQVMQQCTASGLKPSLLQTSAISLELLLPPLPEEINTLVGVLEEGYVVTQSAGYSLKSVLNSAPAAAQVEPAAVLTQTGPLRRHVVYKPGADEDN